MKRLFLLSIIMLCVTVVKAQYTTVNVINNSGRTDLYLQMIGNDGTISPCLSNFTSSHVGPLAASVTYTYTPSTLPFPLHFPAAGRIIGIRFVLFPTSGGTFPGPMLLMCGVPLPPAMTYTFFSSGTNNLAITYPAAGQITITINP